MERQERLTQQQRTVVQVLLLAVELGDESAVSRLISKVAPPDEESAGGRAPGPAAAGQAGLQGLIEGLGQFVAGLKSQIAVSQVAAPGFQFPVGQVTVRRRERKATKDGHGDKSRRRQVLA